MAKLKDTGGHASTQELPNIGGRQTGSAAAPRVPPAAPFYFAWHPMVWHVMAGRVVPRLRTVHLSLGVNGVDIDRAGRPVPQLAVMQAQEAGWTILPWDVDGAGKPAYLYRADNGGWVSRWERLFPGSAETVADEEGYAEWCDSLVQRGIIPEPEDFVLGKLEDKLYSELGNYRKEAQTSPRLERLRQDIDLVKAARKALREALQPLEPEDESLPVLGEAEPAEELPDEPPRKRLQRAAT